MQETLQGRLDYLAIDTTTRDDLKRLKPAIEAHVPAALAQLQSRVDHIPTPVRFLFGKDHIEAGRSGQAAQFRAVLTGQIDAEEAEASTRLGQRHARLKIEPRWHLGGYAAMLEPIIRGVIHDEMDKALQPRRNRLGLAVPREKSEILADADAMAGGLAGVVKSVLLDIDLVVSAHLRKLSDEARANEDHVRNRMRRAAMAAGETLRLVADGQVERRWNEPVEPEFELVRDSANVIAERLATMLTQLRQSSCSLRTATGEIQASAGDLAGGALQQAVSIEQANAMIRQLASTLAENAKRLSAAGKTAKGLVQGADASVTALRTAEAAVEAMQAEGEKLSDLVGLFDEMALKGNLLAVWAAAEAAGAGKAGTGFAEIATQMRELALRAASASLDARRMIEAERTETSNIAGSVARASSALGSISGHATESAQAVDAVAKAGRNQCDALEQVTMVLRGMTDSIAGNAVLGEQASAALGETSLQIEALETVLALFAERRPEPIAAEANMKAVG